MRAQPSSLNNDGGGERLRGLEPGLLKKCQPDLIERGPVPLNRKPQLEAPTEGTSLCQDQGSTLGHEDVPLAEELLADLPTSPT